MPSSKGLVLRRLLVVVHFMTSTHGSSAPSIEDASDDPSHKHSMNEDSWTCSVRYVYPEGGRDAVLTVLGAFLVAIVVTGIDGVVGVFQAECVQFKISSLVIAQSASAP